MLTALPLPVRRPAIPWIAVAVLLFLCLAPIVALFSIGAILDRDCTVSKRTDGDAGANMVWRIEVQRCGGGPEVTNVLVAPRGKSLALVASSIGAPRPIAVHRETNGAAFLRLEPTVGSGPQVVMLPLKATGRPAQPLVLNDGRPVR